MTCRQRWEQTEGRRKAREELRRRKRLRAEYVQWWRDTLKQQRLLIAKEHATAVNARKQARQSARAQRDYNYVFAAINRAKLADKLRPTRLLNHRIANRLRCRMAGAIRAQKANKSNKSFALLGCSLERFMRHIEAQFRPGMTWENHGRLRHIDHIKPCCSFDLTKPAEQRKCFNYHNLQPLFAYENLSKGGRIQMSGA